MKKFGNFIISFILLVFIFLGIVFSTMLIHETFHIFHMKGAQGICLSIGAKIDDDIQKGYLVLYSRFDMSSYENIEEVYSVREQSEKIAYMLEDSLQVALGILAGILIVVLCKKGSKE